jgi:hypothetical protein
MKIERGLSGSSRSKLIEIRINSLNPPNPRSIFRASRAVANRTYGCTGAGAFNSSRMMAIT